MKEGGASIRRLVAIVDDEWMAACCLFVMQMDMDMDIDMMIMRG